MSLIDVVVYPMSSVNSESLKDVSSSVIAEKDPAFRKNLRAKKRALFARVSREISVLI